MKKLTRIASIILAAILLTASFTLASCQKKDDTQLRVAVLNGTTGFGIAPLISRISSGESALNAQIDVYTAADMVSPLIINGTADIAAVPTNLAAVLYNKTNGNIRVLAVNTLGVLYLIENG